MPERKPRKSVAFADGETIVDGNGEITETNGLNRKTSAESHSLGTNGDSTAPAEDQQVERAMLTHPMRL